MFHAFQCKHFGSWDTFNLSWEKRKGLTGFVYLSCEKGILNILILKSIYVSIWHTYEGNDSIEFGCNFRIFFLRVIFEGMIALVLL